MKKSYLKKKGKNPRKIYEEKVNRKWQDWFRALCLEFNIRCEISSEPQEVIHHFIEKSNSANLQFDVRNFIPVSGKTHSLFMFRRSILDAEIGFSRGIEWIEYIKKQKQIHISKSIKWLREQEERLESFDREELAKSYKKLGYFKL